jgi:hypothetical protein
VNKPRDSQHGWKYSHDFPSILAYNVHAQWSDQNHSHRLAQVDSSKVIASRHFWVWNLVTDITPSCCRSWKTILRRHSIGGPFLGQLKQNF